jgi:hypothetical protein
MPCIEAFGPDVIAASFGLRFLEASDLTLPLIVAGKVADTVTNSLEAPRF